MRQLFTSAVIAFGLGCLGAHGQARLTKAAPVRPRPVVPAASRLPAKFFTTYTYTVYLIYDPKYSKEPTNTRGVGGTLTLGAAGSYDKKLQFPGPYGLNHFDQSGHYTIKGNTITFTYLDSKGKAVTETGTFTYSEPALALTMILNQEPDGGREVYGLVVKGSESVKRTFNADGTVKLGD